MWGVYPGVVLALGPFVLTSRTVLIYVRVGWGSLEGGCSWVDNPDVNEERVSTFDVLNVRTDMLRSIARRGNLSNFELQAEVGLLDAGVESLNELVELITDIIMAKVTGSLVEGATEAVEGVHRGIENLTASTDPE